MVILLHTSKSMRPAEHTNTHHPQPILLNKASQLVEYLKTLSISQLQSCMKISEKLATETFKQIQNFTFDEAWQRPALDSFIGDIYSGLHVQSWSDADRTYAQQHLKILSGLYGVLSPMDGIYPYRLEMGYRLPDEPFNNLYKFWGTSIVETIPTNQQIINLTAVEYSKTITPFVDASRVITPKFLTINSKTKQPTFVVVHAKIARGAFARWLTNYRIEQVQDLIKFNDLGYVYSKDLSADLEPVFVCQKFGGLGLSVRLT